MGGGSSRALRCREEPPPVLHFQTGRRSRQSALPCVEKAPVGGAVHQHAVEAKMLDRALLFRGGRVRRMQRQMRETAVARGVARAGIRQGVVVGSGDVDACLAGDEVGAQGKSGPGKPRAAMASGVGTPG